MNRHNIISVFLMALALLSQSTPISGQTSAQATGTQTSTAKPTGETQKSKDKETVPPSAKKKPLTPAEKRSYELLVATLDQSDQIADVNDRSEIVASAAILVWNRDQERARAWLKKTVDSLSDAYERRDDKESRSNIQDSLKSLAKLVASRDSTLALAIIDRLDELKRTYSDGKNNSAESRADKMAIAEEGIGSDSSEASRIASQIIASGVPSSFPGFLYKLAQTDQHEADDLFRQTLAILAGGSTYHLSDALILSVYGFKESQLIVPTTIPARDGKGESYGTIFLNPYRSSPPGLDPAIANEYLSAANSYLNSVLSVNGPGLSSNMLTLGQCFYLVNKLGFYASYFNRSSADSWQQLRLKVLELMNHAGIDPGRLSSQTSFAERLSKGESVIQNDDGVSSFEAADKTQDKKERDDHLVYGIFNLLDHEKFDEADKKTQKINDSAVATRMRDYIDLRAGEAAIRRSAWTEVQSRAAHVSDPQGRIYLLLKGAEAAVKNPKTSKVTIAELLNEAARLTDKLDGSDTKTKLLIVASGLFYKSGDTIRGGQILAAAVHELNGDKPYTDKQSYFSFEVNSNHRMGLVIRDWDFDSSFKEAASKDWEGALMLIEGIQLPKLRLSAQIAAARGST